MTSRSSTELVDFSSERVVSDQFPGCLLGLLVLVLLCFGFWLRCFCFVLEDILLFALTFSPTCGNSQSNTTRFDDRLSAHGMSPKKKGESHIPAHLVAGECSRGACGSGTQKVGACCFVGSNPIQSLLMLFANTGEPKKSLGNRRLWC